MLELEGVADVEFAELNVLSSNLSGPIPLE